MAFFLKKLPKIFGEKKSNLSQEKGQIFEVKRTPDNQIQSFSRKKIQIFEVNRTPDNQNPIFLKKKTKLLRLKEPQVIKIQSFSREKAKSLGSKEPSDSQKFFNIIWILAQMTLQQKLS